MSSCDISVNDDDCNTRFWSLVPIAAKSKISRSMMGKLSKLCCDNDRAVQILRAALKTKQPVTYLGKILAEMQRDLDPPRSNEPEIALHGRLHGWVVRKTARTNGEPAWWVGGVLYDKNGDAIGA